MSNVNPKVIEKFVELNAPMHRTMDEIREYLISQNEAVNSDLPHKKKSESSPPVTEKKVVVEKAG